MAMALLKTISFKYHLIFAFTIRLILIIYGEIHDQNSEIPYTDIDYKVVTDGARHILNNRSPFDRHTYRYSPLLAILLIPNLIIHKSFGKIIFSFFDILVGLMIEKVIHNEFKTIFFETADTLLTARQNRIKTMMMTTSSSSSSSSRKLPIEFHLPEKYIKWSEYSALFWLYNPLTMIIATRGNGDSISCFFVLSTLYFIHRFNSNNLNIFFAGLCHGIAIHLRIYPMIFSLALYLCLSSSSSNDNQQIDNIYLNFKNIFRPNKKQFLLTIGTICSFLCLTGSFYWLYKFQYIHESFLYHFIRKDIRHNFSMYFLMQYLSSTNVIPNFEKLLITMPQLIIFVYLSLTFGTNRKTLSFCIFTQTFCLVTYNSVVTSQYFVWYLALLTLCFKNFKNIPIRLAIAYFTLWIFGQALWLLPAYLLEFKTLNTFNFIGIQGVAFFFVNIFILQRFIRYFDVFSKMKL